MEQLPSYILVCLLLAATISAIIGGIVLFFSSGSLLREQSAWKLGLGLAGMTIGAIIALAGFTALLGAGG